MPAGFRRPQMSEQTQRCIVLSACVNVAGGVYV